MPPRTLNSAVRRKNRGAVAVTRSCNISLVTASWNAPRSRYDQIYSFRALSSTQRASGTYSSFRVAKSGCPVFGHRQLNSGIVIRMVYSLAGAGFSKVSKDRLGSVMSGSAKGFTKVTFTLHYAPHSRPNASGGIPCRRPMPDLKVVTLMRLTKLKIAGFKSFVDPTTVTFPSSLTGVVGPNGCGKSNIIDAVRWVMGEISAKHL